MLTAIITYLNTYGYRAIFLLITLENIFPPIPCEIILTFGGFMTTITNLTPLGVITVASLGSYCGAVVLYWLSYLVNVEKLENLLAKCHFKSHDLSRSLNWFKQYGNISVLLGRLIPIIRSLISLPAGITKMNFFSFSFYTLIGSIIWNSILVTLGIVLGQEWLTVKQYIKQYALLISIIATIILLWKKRRLD